MSSVWHFIVILLKNRRQDPRLFFIEGMTKMQTVSLLLFFLTFCRYLVKKQTSRFTSVFYRRYDQNANRFFASFFLNKIAIFSPIFLDTFYALKILVILLKNRRQDPRLFFIEGMTKMQTVSLLLFFLTKSQFFLLFF